ncbi:MCE family protein [Gordonia amarae]|uniref:Mce family protein n=2 Tax=Gordonia amarae TaxID=36821 RepID=G7GQS7_9ACTN|nr:MCE family protein [Gordonia amarae]MCS3877629.1 phospholipid/cholesterol/gamma-HCH transport system substrate-binding protein [Gordonia amarae]QHN16343.1 MCE family protein [Gordonia amarae]QHN20912.1 MCE family protein [Gordonia amarae]QHN29763.1 MCE family protein [Gordonia amarae]QHN38538.1 MCE family protein [Gordonia amarae]
MTSIGNNRRARRSGRAAGIGAALVATTVAIAGCGIDMKQMPLPGGTDTGSHPREYTIQFDNVLDLVPQSQVKKDGINVGKILSIKVPKDSWQANVKIQVKNDVNLSENAHVEIQQTALLGEKFVALSEPEGSENVPRQDPKQLIRNSVGKQRTRTATDIEQVLGALSMLLNGGGLSQLTPIVNELNKALGNDGTELRSLLETTQTLIGGLNRQRDDIVSAIEGLNRLSVRTNAQTEQIDRILGELPEAVKVLEDQRPQFVDLLTKLDTLGDVGTGILTKSREALITDLRALRPVLSELTKAAPDLITSAPLFPTLPFPDEILPAVHGDSTNLFMTLDLRILNQIEALGVGQGTPKHSPVKVNPYPVDPSNPYVNGNGSRSGWPTVSLINPAPGSQPGPNTPPSGGKYSAKKKKSTAKAKSDDKARSDDKAKPKTQYSVMPAPATADQRFIDGPLSMIGGDK